MKRYGYLIEQVVDESNLLEAFRMVMRGKKRTRTVRLFKKNRDAILAELAEEIRSGRYAPSGFREFEVVENGKTREIQSLPFKDRIALHAIMAVLGKKLGGMLIRDTYASLPRRGIHDGLKRIRRALKDRSNTRYCLKLDIKKFYHSIDQDVLIGRLRRKIKDETMMQTLIRIIHSYGPGLAIGYHSSQLLGYQLGNGIISQDYYHIRLFVRLAGASVCGCRCRCRRQGQQMFFLHVLWFYIGFSISMQPSLPSSLLFLRLPFRLLECLYLYKIGNLFPFLQVWVSRCFCMKTIEAVPCIVYAALCMTRSGNGFLSMLFGGSPKGFRRGWRR